MRQADTDFNVKSQLNHPPQYDRYQQTQRMQQMQQMQPMQSMQSMQSMQPMRVIQPPLPQMQTRKIQYIQPSGHICCCDHNKQNHFNNMTYLNNNNLNETSCFQNNIHSNLNQVHSYARGYNSNPRINNGNINNNNNDNNHNYPRNNRINVTRTNVTRPNINNDVVANNRYHHHRNNTATTIMNNNGYNGYHDRGKTARVYQTRFTPTAVVAKYYQPQSHSQSQPHCNNNNMHQNQYL